MIRQAISCDVCGAEKKQTNHWFVAYEHSGELRVSGWNSRNRIRAGAKHLCGQTCLHKLVDEFMDRIISGRIAAPGAEVQEPEEQAAVTDTSLTSKAAYIEPKPEFVQPKPAFESKPIFVEPKSMHVDSRPSFLASEPARVEARPAFVEELPGYDGFESSARLITPPEPASEPRPMPAATALVLPMQPNLPADESRSGYGPGNRRADAWERERERETRSSERVAEAGRRHRGH